MVPPLFDDGILFFMVVFCELIGANIGRSWGYHEISDLHTHDPFSTRLDPPQMKPRTENRVSVAVKSP